MWHHADYEDLSFDTSMRIKVNDTVVKEVYRFISELTNYEHWMPKQEPLQRDKSKVQKINMKYFRRTEIKNLLIEL
jgi:hypothetical protein